MRCKYQSYVDHADLGVEAATHVVYTESSTVKQMAENMK